MSQLTTVEALQSLLGDQAQAGWQTLVERHGADVWRLILSRSRDAHEAEDVYQDFWMALPRSAASFKPGGEEPERSARAWIMRVAYTTALDRLRRRPLTTVRSSQGASMESATIASVPAEAHLRPGTEDLRDREILLARVQTALNDLPENLRRPLVLYVVGGLSYEDLASDLACTVNNARVRVHRGLKRLREVLGGAQAEVNDRALAGLILPAMLLAPSVPSFAVAAKSGVAGVSIAASTSGGSTAAAGIGTGTIATVAGVTAAGVGLGIALSREPASPATPVVEPTPIVRMMDDFNRADLNMIGHSNTGVVPELSIVPSPAGGPGGNALRFGWNEAHQGWIDNEYVTASKKQFSTINTNDHTTATMQVWAPQKTKLRHIGLRFSDAKGEVFEWRQPLPDQGQTGWRTLTFSLREDLVARWSRNSNTELRIDQPLRLWGYAIAMTKDGPPTGVIIIDDVELQQPTVVDHAGPNR